MTLKDLNIGETAVVGTVGGEGALRQHFLDMGLIPGEEVTLVKFAPMGDPMELSIHGYELTLRLDDAARIGVTLAKAPAADATTPKRARTLCLTTRPLPLRWRATRTAARRPSSTSSPAPTSTSAISRV